jgi:hypothetical protein
MKFRIAPIAALVVLTLSASAQITPVGPFTADGLEGFESHPAISPLPCLSQRVFQNRADMCALGTGNVATNYLFPVGPSTVFSRGGVVCASTGPQGASITFDTPVTRFGGYFGGVLPGTAEFFDVNGASLGTQTINTIVCSTACLSQWNGWSSNGGAPFKRVEVVHSPSSPYGIVVDDLVALFGAGPTGVAYCNGDGSAAPCPCSAPLYDYQPIGCPHAPNNRGARLLGAGSASLASDTVVFMNEWLTLSAPTLYFQGTMRQSGGRESPSVTDSCASRGASRVSASPRVAASEHFNSPRPVVRPFT